MYNWSTDVKKLKKFPRQFRLWKLENLINFGLGGEKVDKKELTRNFAKIKIDPLKRKFLKFILSS